MASKIVAYYLHEPEFQPVAEETVALYVDGVLTCIGPQPEVVSKAIGLLGIEQRFDPDFMKGQEQYVGAAKTLDEIREYKSVAHADEAEALRDQAAELLRRANELEGNPEGN